MEIKLRPFMTPNYAIPEMPTANRQDGFKPVDGVPLSQLEANELSAMCDAYRAEVFRKAGKADPKATP